MPASPIHIPEQFSNARAVCGSALGVADSFTREVGKATCPGCMRWEDAKLNGREPPKPQVDRFGCTHGPGISVGPDSRPIVCLPCADRAVEAAREACAVRLEEIAAALTAQTNRTADRADGIALAMKAAYTLDLAAELRRSP